MENKIIEISKEIEKNSKKSKKLIETEEEKLYEIFKENGYKQSFEKEIVNLLEKSELTLKDDSTLGNVSGGNNAKNNLAKATSVGLASLLVLGSSPMSSVSAAEGGNGVANTVNKVLSSKALVPLSAFGIIGDLIRRLAVNHGQDNNSNIDNNVVENEKTENEEEFQLEASEPSFVADKQPENLVQQSGDVSENEEENHKKQEEQARLDEESKLGAEEEERQRFAEEQRKAEEEKLRKQQEKLENQRKTTDNIVQLMFTSGHCKPNEVSIIQAFKCGISPESLAEACIEKILAENESLNAAKELYDAGHVAKDIGWYFNKIVSRDYTLFFKEYELTNFSNKFFDKMITKSEEMYKEASSDVSLGECFGEMNSWKMIPDDQLCHVKEIMDKITLKLGLNSRENLKQYVNQDMVKRYLRYPRWHSEVNSKMNVYAYLCQSLQGYLFDDADYDCLLYDDYNFNYFSFSNSRLGLDGYLNRLVVSCVFAESDEKHHIDKQKLENVWECIKILNDNIEYFGGGNKECLALSDNVINGLRKIGIGYGSFDFNDVKDYKNQALVEFLDFVGQLYSKFGDKTLEELAKLRILMDGKEYTLKDICKKTLSANDFGRLGAAIVLGDEAGTVIPFARNMFSNELYLDDFTITRNQREKLVNALGNFEFCYFGITQENFEVIDHMIDYAIEHNLLDKSISLEGIKDKHGNEFKVKGYCQCIDALLMKVWKTQFGRESPVEDWMHIDRVGMSVDYFLAGVLLSEKFKNDRDMIGFVKEIGDNGFCNPGITSRLLSKFDELMEHIQGDYTIGQNIEWIESCTYLIPRDRDRYKRDRYTCIPVDCDSVLKGIKC